MQVFVGEAHAALPAVQAALTGYHFPTNAGPVNVGHLRVRLDQAWDVRHSSPHHRTAVGALLPDLIRDVQRAVRTIDGRERRAARRVLAGVYRLTDFYVAYQPAPELVWLVADRALAEAQEADDPYALAGGAWGADPRVARRGALGRSRHGGIGRGASTGAMADPNPR